MVAAGVGVGFFPEGWMRTLYDKHAIRAIESDPPLRRLHYSFQCRRDDIRPLVTAMRERVISEVDFAARSEEQTSELQSLMRKPYAGTWLKKKKQQQDTKAK